MRERPTERDLLDEVALRNMIAKFKDLNLKTLNIAAIPRVGLFWMGLDGTVYPESTSLRDAEDYGDFKIHDGSHYDAWDSAVMQHPEWRGHEYEEIPRGRVVYRKAPKNPEFIVYMPKELRKHEGKIVTEFMLPSGHTRFDFSDEHYRFPGDDDLDADIETAVQNLMKQFGWSRNRALIDTLAPVFGDAFWQEWTNRKAKAREFCRSGATIQFRQLFSDGVFD